MNRPLLEINNLNIALKNAEQLIIENVSLSIHQGECVGILGESGSGKTVTSQAILRLFPSSLKSVSGSIYFEGSDLLNKSEKEMEKIRGNNIGMIFQEPSMALNPTMKIGKQISECIRAHRKCSAKECFTRALELLSLVGISNPSVRYHQYPFEFSGGMKQRVMIAIAIACDPQLVIADEPTTALDMSIQVQILKLLKILQEAHKRSILLITHDLSVAAGICDRIYIMKAGKIVEGGTAEEIFYHPQHPYTKSLLEASKS